MGADYGGLTVLKVFFTGYRHPILFVHLSIIAGCFFLIKAFTKDIEGCSI